MRGFTATAVIAVVLGCISGAAGQISAASPPPCSGAVGAYLDPTGCCKCYPGYEDADGKVCSRCADGYRLDVATGICSNGRNGSSCTTNMPFPHFGCALTSGQAIGSCSVEPSTGRNVFPCICRNPDGSDADCAQLQAESITQATRICAPAGPRMFTVWPNEPVVNTAFSLTVVGCLPTTQYMVLPFYTPNFTETSCVASSDADILQHCRFQRGAEAVLGSSAGNSSMDGAECPKGFLLSGLEADAADKPNMGLTEVTFPGIRMLDAAFSSEDERHTLFRVCASTLAPAKNGTSVTLWKEVDSHNAYVDRRDKSFKVSKEAYLKRSAARDVFQYEDCCQGLHIGASCLPLWAFLILWLLMCCLLAVLAYKLHLAKQEVEAERNNEKYENFDVDDELQQMGGGDPDDEDI